MRRVSILIVSLGSAGTAGAHSLDSEHAWFEQLAHQVFGAHHLALAALLVATGLLVLRFCNRKANRLDSRK